MDKGQLERGLEIQEEIEECQKNIRKADYMVSEKIPIRHSYLNFIGIDDSVVVPETLFRIIGKLILSEYNQRLIDLQNEFDRL